MKKLIGMLALTAVVLSLQAGKEKESAATKLAKTKELVTRYSGSSVTVKIDLALPPDEETEGFRFGYLCPNCNSIHYRSAEEYVEKERPVEAVGYLVAPDRVLMQDLAIPSTIVKSLQVEFAGKSYSAEAVKRYPTQRALELKTAQPVAGAKPLVFQKGDPLNAADLRFFYSIRENGQSIAGLAGAGGLPVRHYAELNACLTKVPANCIALNGKGEAVSLSFRNSLRLDEAFFAAPSTWKGEEPKALEARQAALKARVTRSLVPVFVRREVEKSKGRRSIIFRNDREENNTEIDTLAFALPQGELLTFLSLDASQTAEIEKLEAVLPDGSRKALEYVGTFDKYGFVLLRFPDGKLPDAFEPMPFDEAPAASHFLSKLYTVSARSLDGRLTLEMVPEEVHGFDSLRGGEVAPDLRMNKSNGRQAFAVTEKGALVMGSVQRRSGERWSRDEEMSVRTMAALVRARSFNPEFALRKGKDRIRVAWIGTEVQPLTDELAREKKAAGYLAAFNTPGALVRRVYADSPAAKAGLQADDILLFVRREGENKRHSLSGRGGMASDVDLEELYSRIGMAELGIVDADRIAPWPNLEEGINETFTQLGIGADVVIDYVRNGEKKSVKMKLAQAPTHFRKAKRLRAKEMGAIFAELTFEVRGYFKLPDDAPGLVVCKVQPGNPAAVAGLRPYEVVTHVDNQPVKDVKSFGDLVRGKSEFSLSVRRLEKTRVVRIKLGAKGE